VGDVGPAGDALVSLIAAQTEQDVYDAVVEVIHEALPGSIVICSALEAPSDRFRVVATAGLDGHMGRVVSMLGLDPTTVSYGLADMRPEELDAYRSGNLEWVEGGIHALSLGTLPGPACAGIERLLGIGSIHAIGFAWEGFHYGGVSIALPKDGKLEHVAMIEGLVHQATIVVRRLRAERELQDRTAELDVFFSESLDLLAVADMQGYFRRVNPEWVRALGYSVEELEGARYLDLVHPDDLEATAQAMRRLAEGRPELRFVNRYRASDGTYRHLEWRAFPRGDLVYAAARDLTERIEAEQALRVSEARYRLMADNTADVIWIFDIPADRFTYVSPSVERLRGYTVHEALQQSMEQALTPDSLRYVTGGLAPRIAALEAGDDSAAIVVSEVEQPCKDGSIVATEVTTTFLRDAAGRIDRILGVSRDITERRRAEAEIHALNESLEARVHERTAQLEEAISELEAFSYSVSHDLRAPLRAINGYATILTEDHAGNIGEDGLRYCDAIIGNTRRMGQLIDDLLSFSRLGRTRPAREPIDMHALVNSALGEITTESQRGAVTFAVSPLPSAIGDPTLLRQVWANLLSNALKFTAGVPEPTVTVRSLPGNGETVYAVTDNGPGFDMRHADKLFQVFERLHGSDYEGSGIGLAIVRRAVESHGGRVWAEGAPGEGATFSFSLPAAGPPQRHQAAS
jgi:PAS domain S-box-containing protein